MASFSNLGGALPSLWQICCSTALGALISAAGFVGAAAQYTMLTVKIVVLQRLPTPIRQIGMVCKPNLTIDNRLASLQCSPSC